MVSTLMELFLVVFELLVLQIDIIYSVSWCPYQTERIVPCRIRNGSEPYMANICWSSPNGSQRCNTKMMHRPKFITVYKTLRETKYKWDPDCRLNKVSDCFNCTLFKAMSAKIHELEERLENHQRNYIVSQSQTHRNVATTNMYQLDSKLKLRKESKDKNEELHLSKLVNSYRKTEEKVQKMEQELLRISRAIQEISTGDTPGIVSNKINKNEKDIINQHGVHSDSDSEPKKNTDEKNNLSAALKQNIKNDPTMQKNEKRLQGDFLLKSNRGIQPVSNKKYSRKNEIENKIHKTLENNLDRGDIASTLNDDYGDEFNLSTMSDEYGDQLRQLI